MEIKRDMYLNKLIRHKGNGMVKIITGVRRCGKSYLLFKLFRDHLIESGIAQDHIISIALDDYGNRALQNPDELYNYVKSRITDDGNYYILLDEIQMVNDFESVVNGFLHIPNADIYITGSNSKFLSTDILTEFRGRGDEIRVYPLCFSEFYSAYGGEFDKVWLMYCNYGGMPLCLSMQTQEDKAKYLTNLFETTYLADIINRNNLRGNAEINELTDILASSIGGGLIELDKVNGIEVHYKGDYPTIAIVNKDVPGVIAKVSSIISDSGINIENMSVTPQHEGENKGYAIMVLGITGSLTKDIEEKIKSISDVKNFVFLDKLY